MVTAVRQGAEEHVLKTLEQARSESFDVNLFEAKFSTLDNLFPGFDDFTRAIQTALGEKEGALLYCRNGDVFIEWRGETASTLQILERAIIGFCKEKHAVDLPDDFFQYYNYYVDNRQLRDLFTARMKQHPTATHVDAGEIQTIIEGALHYTPEQTVMLNKAILTRRTRGKPTILIVEDQPMSQKLMVSVLEQSGTCHVAATAEEAMLKYAELAPDITFLDVELPDSNGHELAFLFRHVDAAAHLVMVTSNNYRKDVEQARANKVQGFIVKPYTREKLLSAIASYNQ